MDIDAVKSYTIMENSYRSALNLGRQKNSPELARDYRLFYSEARNRPEAANVIKRQAKKHYNMECLSRFCDEMSTENEKQVFVDWKDSALSWYRRFKLRTFDKSIKPLVKEMNKKYKANEKFARELSHSLYKDNLSIFGMIKKGLKLR